MAYTYLFFKPKRLPLAPYELGLDTVEVITDAASAKVALDSAALSLEWLPDGSARGETATGSWLEFHIHADSTLAMRCSLRADYSAYVQRICDALNWIAVDEKPRCFQPGRAPIES